MYVLKRGAFMHVFETIYTFNFILGIIRITQLIKSWLPSIGVSSLVISVSFFFHHSSSLVSESYQTYLFKTQRWQYINLDIFKRKSVFLTDFSFRKITFERIGLMGNIYCIHHYRWVSYLFTLYFSVATVEPDIS